VDLGGGDRLLAGERFVPSQSVIKGGSGAKGGRKKKGEGKNQKKRKSPLVVTGEIKFVQKNTKGGGIAFDKKEHI